MEEQAGVVQQQEGCSPAPVKKKSFLPSWLLESKASLKSFNQTVKSTRQGLRVLGESIDTFNTTIEETKARAAAAAAIRQKTHVRQSSLFERCPPEVWELILPFMNLQTILNVSLVERR